jgi:TonB family protein
MKLESTRVPESSLGSLSSCLVEGDAVQLRGSQKIRRRAVLFSFFVQTIVVAALVIFPLLGKGERIPVRIFVERPPYRFDADHPNAGGSPQQAHRSASPCIFCRTSTTPQHFIAHQSASGESKAGEAPSLSDGPVGNPDGVPNGLEPEHRAPTPPQFEIACNSVDRRVYLDHIDPARLARRVEPSYPHLGVQLHRETRVKLHAIIATDGSIQSLQVLSGDPLFYQSAVDAVSQWQYRPTILNGKPIEVDTRITVIYSLK